MSNSREELYQHLGEVLKGVIALDIFFGGDLQSEMDARASDFAELPEAKKVLQKLSSQLDVESLRTHTLGFIKTLLIDQSFGDETVQTIINQLEEATSGIIRAEDFEHTLKEIGMEGFAQELYDNLEIHRTLSHMEKDEVLRLIKEAKKAEGWANERAEAEETVGGERVAAEFADPPQETRRFFIGANPNPEFPPYLAAMKYSSRQQSKLAIAIGLVVLIPIVIAVLFWIFS